MVSLGDRGAFLTWCGYHRWPMFAILFAVIGAVIGALLMGFVGFFAGASGGIMLGLLLGIVMGKDQRMFPVEVDKWVGFSSGDFGSAGKYPGRVVTQVVKTGASAPIERSVVEFMDGFTIRVLPPYSLSVWFRDGNNRKLKILQTDRHTYLPISVKSGIITVYQVPVYEKAQDGRLARYKADASGEFVTEKVKNDKGEEVDSLIPDAQGAPRVLGYKEEVIFDSNIMQNEAGDIVSIPKGLAAKMDNERVNYTIAHHMADILYKEQGSWWAEHGKEVLALVSMVFVLVIVLFGYIKYSEISANITDKLSASINSAAASNLEAAKLNAQMTAVLLKVGYNYTVVFEGMNGSISAPQQAVTPIKLPFG